MAQAELQRLFTATETLCGGSCNCVKDCHDALIKLTGLARDTQPKTFGDYMKGIATCARYLYSETFDPNGEDSLQEIGDKLEEPSTYDCDGCATEYAWCALHETSAGDRCCPTCVECVSCGYAYRPTALTDGICYSCIDDGYFSCGNCGEWFNSESELWQHELNCDFWGTCNHCGQDLYGEEEWSHIESGYCPEVMPDWLKDGSEPGFCDICGYWVDELPVHNWDEH